MIAHPTKSPVLGDFRTEKCKGYCSEYHMESLTPLVPCPTDWVPVAESHIM